MFGKLREIKDGCISLIEFTGSIILLIPYSIYLHTTYPSIIRKVENDLLKKENSY